MDETQGKIESIVSLMERDLPVDPCWIEPGILPKGSKMMFGGAPKVGKSMFLLELCQNLALGETPFGCPLFRVPEPAKVLLIEKEIGIVGLQIRAKKAYAGIENTSLLEQNYLYNSKDRRMRLDTVEGHRLLREAVTVHQPDVLVLDPVGKMHSWDENSNTNIGMLFDVLDGLIDLGSKWGMAIILSHHFGKPPRDDRVNYDPLDFNNYRGAIRWSTDPDTLVTTHRMENLATRHEAWRLATRWRLRQGESLPDLYFTVNEKEDLRVRYERGLEGATVAQTRVSSAAVPVAVPSLKL